MAEVSKSALDSAIRNDILEKIGALLAADFQTDVLSVSSSEITIPVVDAEGNEKFALIKVSIPRGTRNGNGGYDAYDGYAAAEDYKEDCAATAAKKAASEAKKAAKEQERERKRSAKTTIRELNAEGFDALISKPIEEEG